MYLYKIEVEIGEQMVYIVAAAESDEKAFQQVEGQLVRHFVKKPQVKEMSIVEKKRLTAGAGYVIETNK